MNENTKTIVFIVAAAACLGLSMITAPVKRDPSSKTNQMGQPLFETFDPREATGIEIVEIDEEKIEAKSIEVTQTSMGWFIRRPGKTDYPANADNQVKAFPLFYSICVFSIKQEKEPASMPVMVCLIQVVPSLVKRV